MKTRHLIVVSTLVLAAGTAAQAADAVRIHANTVPVIAPSSFSWDGFYAGGEIGGSWARNKSNVQGSDQKFTRSMKSDGFIGGLYAGYNFDVGNNIILGAETDFLWSKVDGKQSRVSDDVTRKLHVRQKWVGATRARLGYAADRWLPYVAAGVAYSKINATVSGVDAEGAVAGDVNKASKTRTGWTGGAGVDYAMTDNLLLRVEYRYTDFGKKNFMRKENVSGRISHKANDFRVGVAYKF